jgi:hypothetical protein
MFACRKNSSMSVTNVVVFTRSFSVAPAAGQRDFEVLADLADLGPHVALADDVAVAVARQLARDEDHAPPLDRNDVRVEDLPAHDALVQRRGLDVITLHRRPPEVGRVGVRKACDERTGRRRVKPAGPHHREERDSCGDQP